MMLRGRVRSSRTLRLRCCPSMVSPGICTIGTHHASPMLARSAPCAIAMRSPSPVLFGGETAPCMGPRRKALTSNGIPFEAAGTQDHPMTSAHGQLLTGRR